MNAKFSLVVMIISMTSFQVLLKLAAMHLAPQLGMVNGILLNPWLWAAACASIFGILSWLIVLRKIPLSVAYPWTSVIYLIVPLVGAWLFGDILSISYLAGLLSVLIGVLLAMRGSAAT